MNAYLFTEDGNVITGVHAGAAREVVSTLTPNTAAVGYTGILTDPASAGEMLLFTYPLIGNSGVNRDDMESERIRADAVVVRELSRVPSNFRSELFLQDFLLEYDIPAIEGVDTRALAKKLRESGAVQCLLTTEEGLDKEEAVRRIKAHKAPHPVTIVSVREKRSVRADADKANGRTIAVLDFGIRASLLKTLTTHGFDVTLYPFDTPAKGILDDDPERILLSGGPGHPMISTDITNNVRTLCASGKEVIGIGLGHQAMALAHGISVSEMKFGHHGSNYPVRAVREDKVTIVSEHCRYVADETTVTGLAEITHVNVNDKTIEGLSYEGEKARGIQYEPAPSDPVLGEFLQ